ncbi:MAG: HAD family hydrolase [Micavibrio sp.]|nr:HAD family hydrolase [Micavibrio sp.]
MNSKNISDYDLIIFDCDGTLVDSEYLNNKVSADLLNDFGLKQYTPENFMAEFTGFTWSDIRRIIETRHQTKLPDNLITTYVEWVNELLEENLQPVRGAMEFVDACHRQINICVGSNGQRSNVLKSLDIGGFSPKYFSEENIFTRIQVPVGKPEPDLFLFAAANMNALPERCLVIEDSSPGVEAGVAAGMDVLGFTGVSHAPSTQEKRLFEAGAKAVFTDIIHIREYLDL